MKKILYVDMDGVLVDFGSAVTLLSDEIRRQFKGRLDEVPGIFRHMKPMPRAIESFYELSKMFKIFILSTGPWENPSAWSDKLFWVKKHLGQPARKRLILTHHKELNLGDFLVDDRRKNGTNKFKGEHIHFNTKKFPDWPSVIGYLREKAEKAATRDRAVDVRKIGGKK